MKKSKQAAYDKYFERYWKNKWKGIKSLISPKTVASSVLTLLLSLDNQRYYNSDTITNLYDIAKTFNNYFASIVETTKKTKQNIHINIFQTIFLMKVVVQCFFFLQPTDKEEIANIILSLNSDKASDPISIPYRILFLLKNKISKQLVDLFNLSFMTGAFPSVLKTEK